MGLADVGEASHQAYIDSVPTNLHKWVREFEGLASELERVYRLTTSYEKVQQLVDMSETDPSSVAEFLAEDWLRVFSQIDSSNLGDILGYIMGVKG